MTTKKRRPFGTWPSPISSELAARGSVRFGALQSSGGVIYWTESRPQENGRQVILSATGDGQVRELLPAPFSARSRVHEYGGGEFLVAGETVYFVNDRDQDVYALTPGSRPVRITKEPGTRFADFAHDPAHRRLIAVAEQHVSGAAPRNLLAAIGLGGIRGQNTELAAGRDFYASPRLSPDGSRLAWLAWDLPDMPWDSAALYVATVRGDGTLGRPRRIAGGNGSAVFQPGWGPDGKLYFIWDESGWGHLYRHDGAEIVRVHGAPGAELARPLWVFHLRSYALGSDGKIGAVSLVRGTPCFEVGNLASGTATQLPRRQARPPRIDDPVAFGTGFAALIATSATPPAVMTITKGGFRPLAPTPPAEIEAGFISRGEVREFANAHGETVFATYYPPANARCRGPSGAAPPALIFVHGGPTSMSDRSLRFRTQFFTSRGFAVCDVDYAGSTGYGRAYRQRLDGQWGIADVADCAAAARHLATEGLADGGRITISGGSAGGYTTLMALARTDVFAAGSCHYGVSDLKLLLEHTHKFESGYLHRLMGTTRDRWKEVFAERSPLSLIDRIRTPVILFQGLDDKVVPPEQSRLMVAKLERRGVDVEYHEFAGEGHGFRSAATIIAVLEAELAFLQRVLRLGR